MLHLLSVTMGNMTVGLIQVSEAIDKELDAEHRGPGHTSHEQQNN